MKYLVDMPDDWKGPGQYDCSFCYIVNECYPDKCPKDCPLAKAQEAVEVTNSLSRALQASDSDRIYIVKGEE